MDDELIMDDEPFIIHLLPDGRDVECGEEDTLLEALERDGNPIPFGCRKGQCGSCKAKLVDGEVEIDDAASSFALPGDEREDGWILLCCSIPLTDRVTVEVQIGESTMDAPGAATA